MTDYQDDDDDEIAVKPAGCLQVKEFYHMDPEFQRMQWLVRSSYEEAWKAAGGDPVQSPDTEKPVGWRASWMNSNARGFLIELGFISGKDSWR